jgi:two-component sensor histidine kinase
MERRLKTSLFPLLFPTLVGLTFLVVVPIVSILRIEDYHERMDSGITPIRQGIRLASERAYRMQSDVFCYQPTLDPGFKQDYWQDKQRWQKIVTGMPRMPQTHSDLSRAWNKGVVAIATWMQMDAEPCLQDGEQNGAIRGIQRFRVGINALDQASVIAATISTKQRSELQDIWQTSLIAETAVGAVCLLLGVMAWRNARALQWALGTASDNAERLALAIKETNHRVKNNLQTIGALIDMSRLEYEETIPRRVLDDVYRQVRTVAAVHDFLSHEQRGDVVNAQPMLHRLAELAADSAALTTEVKAEVAMLPVKEATSMALITNELVINAGKHGAKRVTIDFCRHGGDYCLCVFDDGPGFPSDFSVAAYANIGLNLIETLARHDLRGSTQWSNHDQTGGAQIQINFPVPQLNLN